MSIILDVILIAILVGFIAAAVKKGFVLSLLELIAIVVAVALAFSFSPVVAQAAYEGVVEDAMISSIEKQLNESINASGITEGVELVINALPEFIVSFAQSAGVDVNAIKQSVSMAELDTNNLATEIVTKVAEPIVVGILTVVFFIILALLLCFVLKILAKIISKLFDIPIVGKVNKTLGGILGAIKGLVVLVLICTVLQFMFANGDNEIAVAVQESFVINLLEKINPFIESLRGMF